MMDLLRRRHQLLTVEDIPPLPYPDAFMVIFNCNANTSKSIMFSNSINRYILDGVETVPSSPVSSVKPTTDGRHILYFWLSKNERLTNTVDVLYVRIPENPTYFHDTFIYTSWSLTRIDFLSSTPPTVNKNNFYMGFGSRTVYVRCPKGSYAAYDTWLKNNVGTVLKKGAVLSETNNFIMT